jgi:polyisoprenoid-binding protein YceI
MAMMKHFSKKAAFAGVALSALVLAGFSHRVAAMREFSLEDKKGANGITFSMIGGLEPLNGFGNDVRGSIMFDMDSPEKSSGKVIIGTKSLKVTSDVMSSNMKGGWCLDVDKFPEATFVVSSAKVKKFDKKMMKVTGEVTGDFTIKDVTKKITVPVVATYVPNGVKERFGEIEGDLLMVRADFSFNRFDYEVGKAVKESLLSNKVDVHLSVASMAFKK